MKKILAFTLTLLTLVFVACSPSNSESMASPSDEFRESLAFVLVERLDPAYVVYYGIPADIDDASLTDLQTSASDNDGLELISSDDFPGIDLALEIKLNEYENAEVGTGILELIQRYPMTPFGLTWNGGVAFTYNDYQFSESLYEQYQSNPDGYLKANARDLRTDPTNPVNHLGPLWAVIDY